VDVKARVTGYLDKVMFRDGEDVKSGQTLYEIDPRPYEAAVQNAKGAVASAQAALENYTSELARVRRMRAADAASREEYDKTLAARDQARAQQTSSEAAQRSAELNLSFCTIKAPISGRISRTRITVGNLVSADQTALTSIVSLDPIYAYFDADEETVLRVQRM